jgi:hypothetical protein
MSNLVHNERLKLRATFLSNLGIAGFIACFVTPGFFEFAETPDRAPRHGPHRSYFLRRPPQSRDQQAEWAKRMKLSNYLRHRRTSNMPWLGLNEFMLAPAAPLASASPIPILFA